MKENGCDNIRVLHLMPRMNYFGGTARKLRYILENSEKGFKHICAVTKTDGTSWLNKIELLVIDGNENILKEAEWVYNISKKKNIKLIVSHFLHMSIVASIAAMRLNIPFVYQEHGIILGDNPLKYPLRAWAMAKAQLIVVNSYATGSALEKKYPFIYKKLRVVYNGIEPMKVNYEYNLRRLINVHEDAFLIGTIGGYLPSRKHDILIKAVAGICSENKNIHLVCLGEGGSEAKKMKQLAQKLAPSNIHFLNRTTNVGGFLKDLNIYANPAVAEGFGIAICEAMLMEKPVIAARAGALPEFCFDGCNSLLIRPNNIDSLQIAIKTLMVNEVFAKRLGKNAAVDITRRFPVERYLLATNAVCYEAISRKRCKNDKVFLQKEKRLINE